MTSARMRSVESAIIATLFVVMAVGPLVDGVLMLLC
jgi:hypothetical protein